MPDTVNFNYAEAIRLATEKFEGDLKRQLTAHERYIFKMAYLDGMDEGLRIAREIHKA